MTVSPPVSPVKVPANDDEGEWVDIIDIDILNRADNNINERYDRSILNDIHPNVNFPQTYLNDEVIPVVDSDKHLGNYLFTNITHKNIIDNICDLYQRSNRVISDFRVCDSNALDSLHRTYGMHMYSCELWDLNCNYIKDLKVAWRKIKRRIWRLLCRANNAIVH